MVEIVKGIRYFKYLLLILSYGVSIIIYHSPSLIPVESFINLQFRELFNSITKIMMLSALINVAAIIIPLGIAYIIDLIIDGLTKADRIDKSVIQFMKIKSNNFKDNLDVLNPFLLPLQEFPLGEKILWHIYIDENHQQ